MSQTQCTDVGAGAPDAPVLVPATSAEIATAASEAYVCIGDVPASVKRQAPPDVTVDPVTFSVLGGALFEVCQEMDLTLRKTSLSPIINLGRDFSCALFTADAQLVAQTCNCPGHVGSLHYAVMACIEKSGAEMLRDGDTFILNDPFRGGTHLPDITLVAPVFDAGELAFFVANRAHHSDVGGSVPGSFPMSREIFEEGIRIPPLRLYEGGRRVESVIDILLANVRTPREVEGDLDALVAANDAGIRALRRLTRRFGRDALLATAGASLDHSERALRAALDIAPGRYTAEDWMDGSGTSDAPVRIAAAVTIADRSIFVDFTGTDPQAAGPVNSVFGTTVSMAVAALLGLTDPTIMPNHGFYRPIHVRAPLGSAVNPRFPAPAVGFPDVCNRIVEVLMQALTPVLPERVIAATSGTSCNTFFGGNRPDTGEPYVWYSINSQGGWGGRVDADGWHDTCFIEANGWDVPVETIEYRYPWRVVSYGIREESAGAGRHRGGEGSRLALTPVGHDALMTINADRARTRPYGLFGGQPGAVARCTIQRADGTIEDIAPGTLKRDGVLVREGDVVRIDGTSGGGYGNPLDRDPEFVATDVRDRLISTGTARDRYGVVLDATGGIDAAGTHRLRERLRARFDTLAADLPPIDRDGYELTAEGADGGAAT
jgi:N-methylhydantoinase B